KAVGKAQIHVRALDGDIRRDNCGLRRRHVHNTDCGSAVINGGVESQLLIDNGGRTADYVGEGNLLSRDALLYDSDLVVRFAHVIPSIFMICKGPSLREGQHNAKNFIEVLYYFYNKKSNRTRFWTVRTRYTAPDRPTGPVLT